MSDTKSELSFGKVLNTEAVWADGTFLARQLEEMKTNFGSLIFIFKLMFFLNSRTFNAWYWPHSCVLIYRKALAALRSCWILNVGHKSMKNVDSVHMRLKNVSMSQRDIRVLQMKFSFLLLGVCIQPRVFSSVVALEELSVRSEKITLWRHQGYAMKTMKEQGARGSMDVRVHHVRRV